MGEASLSRSEQSGSAPQCFAGPVSSAPTIEQCEASNDKCPVAALRQVLAREEFLLAEKDELIRRQETLSQEADHRLLNSLQMISSLLNMQARSATSGETASELIIASSRVSALARMHARLHSLDGAAGVPFKEFLEDICTDTSAMLWSQGHAARVAIEAVELTLPGSSAVPLGFIVNELITNAAKYGEGQITVRLMSDDSGACALSVSNNGSALPEGFSPADYKGLGMKLIRSFVDQIGGALEFGRADANQGACFTVRFLIAS